MPQDKIGVFIIDNTLNWIIRKPLKKTKRAELCAFKVQQFLYLRWSYAKDLYFSGVSLPQRRFVRHDNCGFSLTIVYNN